MAKMRPQADLVQMVTLSSKVIRVLYKWVVTQLKFQLTEILEQEMQDTNLLVAEMGKKLEHRFDIAVHVT